MDPIYGQMSYTCCLSKAFELKLGQNLKIFSDEIHRVSEKEITDYVIRLTMEISPSRVQARCVQMLIIIHTLWKVLKRVEERRERRMVGKRMIIVLM
jgi:hypothetical protein